MATGSITAYASGYANQLATGTWASQSSAYGSTTGTYCTWTNASRRATSGIDFNGFGTWSNIPAGSTIDSVVVSIKGYVSNTTYIDALTAQAFVGSTGKGSGATTLTRTTTTTNVYADITYTDITLAELQGNTLAIRLTTSHNNSTTSAVAYWDYFAVTVNFTFPTQTAVAAVASVPAPTPWVLNPDAQVTVTGVVASVSVPVPWLPLKKTNTLEGYSVEGTNITAANSGGGSGDAFDLVSIAAGTITAASSAAYSSNYGMHLVSSGTSTAYTQWKLSGVGATSKVWWKCSNTSPTVSLMTLSAVTSGLVRVRLVGGYLVLQNASLSTIWTSASPLSASTWYRIEISALQTSGGTSDGTLAIAYYTNGVSTPTEVFKTTTDNAGQGGFKNANYGVTDNAVNGTYQYDFDNFELLNYYVDVTQTLATPSAVTAVASVIQPTVAFTAPWVGTAKTTISAGSSNITGIDITNAPNNEWVYLWIVLSSTSTAISITGWEVVTDNTVGLYYHYALFRRKKVAGDTVYTASWTGATCQGVARPICWRGLDSTNPNETIATATSETTNSYSTGSATPGSANRWVAAFYGTRADTDSSYSFTPDAALTERADSYTSSATQYGFAYLEIADSNGSSISQQSHSYTSTFSTTSQVGSGHLLYLIPAIGVSAGATVVPSVVASVASVPAPTSITAESSGGIQTPWVGTAAKIEGSSTTNMQVDISGATTGEWVYCFAVIGLGLTGGTMTMTGWTAISEADNGSSFHYGLFRRKKQAGDTTFTVSWSGSTKGTAQVVSWPGLDGTTPNETPVYTLHTSTNTNFSTGSGTPSTADRWAATFHAVRSGTSGETWTPPSGLTERSDDSNSGAAAAPYVALEINDSGAAVTQASHSYTATLSQSDTYGVSILLYLAPTSPDATVGAAAVAATTTIPAHPVGLAWAELYDYASSGWAYAGTGNIADTVGWQTVEWVPSPIGHSNNAIKLYAGGRVDYSKYIGAPLLGGQAITGKSYARVYFQVQGLLPQYAGLFTVQDRQSNWTGIGLWNSGTTSVNLEAWGWGTTDSGPAAITPSYNVWYRSELDVDWPNKTWENRLYLGDSATPLGTWTGHWTTDGARTNPDMQGDALVLNNNAGSVSNIIFDELAFSKYAQPGPILHSPMPYTVAAVGSVPAPGVIVPFIPPTPSAVSAVTAIPNIDLVTFPTSFTYRWRADSGIGVSDGSSASSWTDSVAGLPVSQGTGSRQPVYRASVSGLNNKPALQFTRSSQQFLAATSGQTGLANFLKGYSGATIFIVCYPTNITAGFEGYLTWFQVTGGARPVVEMGTASNSKMEQWTNYTPGNTFDGTKNLSNNNPYALTYINVPNGSNQTRNFVNGDNDSAATTWPNIPNTYDTERVYIGSTDSTSETVDGYIAEILVYPSALSANDQADVLAYMGTRYGITINSKNVKPQSVSAVSSIPAPFISPYRLVQAPTPYVYNPGGNTAQLAFGSNVTAGNWIIGVLSYGNNDSIQSISDTLGNNLSSVIVTDQEDTTNVQKLAVFAFQTAYSGAETVTVTFTGTLTDYKRLSLSEWSGVGGLDTYHASGEQQAADANPDNMSSGAATSTIDGDLIIGAFEDSITSTPVAGTGFTQIVNTNNSSGGNIVVEYKTQTTHGSVTATASGAAQWDEYLGAVLAFYPSGSAANASITASTVSGTSSIPSAVAAAGAKVFMAFAVNAHIEALEFAGISAGLTAGVVSAVSSITDHQVVIKPQPVVVNAVAAITGHQAVVKPQPNAVTGTSAVPTVTIVRSALVIDKPAVAGVVAVPTVTGIPNNVKAISVAAIGAIPAPTVAAVKNVSITAAAITGIVSVPTATKAAGSVVVPAAVNGVSAITGHQVVVWVQPSVVVAVSSVPSGSLITDSIVTVIAVGATCAVPMATLTTVQDAQVTASAVNVTSLVWAVTYASLQSYFGDPSTYYYNTNVNTVGQYFTVTSPFIVYGIRYWKRSDSIYDGVSLSFKLWRPISVSPYRVDVVDIDRTQQASDPVGWVTVPFDPVIIYPGSEYVAQLFYGGFVSYSNIPFRSAVGYPISNPPFEMPNQAGGQDYGFTEAHISKSNYGTWYIDVVGYATGSIIAGSTLAPNAVTGTAGVPSPTVSTSADVNINATIVSTVASVPTTTEAAGAVKIAAVVVSTAAVLAQTVSVGSVLSLTTVNGIAAVPTAVEAGGAVKVAAVVAGIAAVPSPTPSASSRVVASAVAAITATPTVQPVIKPQPAVVVAIGAVPSVAVIRGQTVAVVAVAGTSTVPTVSFIVTALVVATAVNGIGTVPVVSGIPNNVKAVLVIGVSAVPSITVTAVKAASVTAAVVAAIGSISSVAFTSSVLSSATQVASTTAIGSVVFFSHVSISAVAVAGSGAVPSIAVVRGQTVAAAVVVGIASVPSVGIIAWVIKTAAVVSGTVAIPPPQVVLRAQPALVSGTVAVPAPTPFVAVAIVASVVVGTATVPQVTYAATLRPVAVIGVGEVPAVSLITWSVFSVSAVSGTTTITPPALSGGSVVIAALVVSTSAQPSPVTKAGSVALPGAVISVSAIATPSITSIHTAVVVSVIGAVPSAMPAGGAETALAAVLAVGSVPAPTFRADSVLQAVLVAGTSTVLSATVIAGGGITISVTRVQAVAAVPTTAEIAGVTKTVAVVTATSTVSTFTFTSSVTIIATIVTSVGTIPSFGVAAGAVATALVVSAVGAVPSVGFAITALVVANAVSGTTAIALPIHGQASPRSVNALAAIGTIAIVRGQTVSVAAVGGTAGVPSLTVVTVVRVSVGAVICAIFVPAVSFTSRVNVLAAVVATTTTVEAVGFTSSATVVAVSVGSVGSVGTTALVIGQRVAVTTVEAIASIPTATIVSQGNVFISAALVVATAAVPTLVLHAGQTVTVIVVLAVSSVAVPPISTGAGVLPVQVQAIGAVASVSVFTGTAAFVSAVVVAAIGAVPTVTVIAVRNALVSPTVVVGVGFVPSVSIVSGHAAQVAANVIAAIANIGTATVTSHALVLVSAINGYALVATAAGSASSQVVAAVITASSSTAGGAEGSAQAVASTVSGTASIELTTVFVGTLVAPTVIVLTATVEPIEIAGSTTLLATTVTVTTTVLHPFGVTSGTTRDITIASTIATEVWIAAVQGSAWAASVVGTAVWTAFINATSWSATISIEEWSAENLTTWSAESFKDGSNQ